MNPTTARTLFSMSAPRVRRLVTLAFVTAVILGGAGFTDRAGAAGAQFTNVSAQAGAMSLGVGANYIGPGPVTLTIGTSQNVYASKVAQVSKAAPGVNNRWSFLVGNLDAGTSYWYRLHSPVASYISPVASKTMTRKVVIDYDRVDVIDDGDAWPNGCGDFWFAFRHGTASSGFRSYNGGCIDSGGSKELIYVWAEAGTSNDWKSKTVRDELFAWDNDIDGYGDDPYADCFIPFWQDVNCGDRADSHRNIDVTQAGTRTLLHSVTGQNNRPWVIFSGTLTVSYS